MRYGKIRIENGNLIFIRHMIANTLPCTDILWAYLKRESSEAGNEKQLPVTYLCILTKRRKQYQFEMTEREVHDCLRLLGALNPEITVGFPRGKRIEQYTLPNTRDFGGMLSADGKCIIPKSLLRSGNLYHTSLVDLDTLTEVYKVKTIIDFRTYHETVHMPDTIPEGVEYHHVPILEDSTPGITMEKGILYLIRNFDGDAEHLMCEHYKNMIRDFMAIKQFARFMDLLVRHEEGAVLFHDNLGTHRTGLASAILLGALGIPENTIREDYMKGNQYLEKEEEYIIRLLENKTIVDKRIISNVHALVRVKEIYLDSAFQEIDREYGSFDAFLKKELYLTQKSIEILKEKYMI